MPSLDKFKKSGGVIAARAFEVSTGRLLVMGPSGHDDLLTASAAMIDMPVPGEVAPLQTIRVLLTYWTIVVERTDGGWIVAVMIETGHAIAKSLSRMIRVTFKPEKVEAGKSPKPAPPMKKQTIMANRTANLAVLSEGRGIDFDTAATDANLAGRSYMPTRVLTTRDFDDRDED